MNPALVVRFRPLGPWRIGTDSGARDRAASHLHSDVLFSAVCAAMREFGLLESWLRETVGAGAGPAVRLGSVFPAMGDTLFVTPPRSLWPPAPSPRVRWGNARYVPLAMVRDLVQERSLREDRWYVDGPSGCLLPENAKFRSGPFRPVTRSQAAVDRLRPGAVEAHRWACLEFAEGGGLWTVAAFADDAAREQWSEPLQGAFRYLADTCLGGQRSLGWGRSAEPEFQAGTLPELILPAPPPPRPAGPEEPEETPLPPEIFWWLLSVFSPAPDDDVDWSRGAYSLLTRAGRVESPAGSGALKRLVRMVEEGSVLAAPAAPRGAAPDVAPEGFPHPVYRAGFALAIPIPMRHPERVAGAL